MRSTLCDRYKLLLDQTALAHADTAIAWDLLAAIANGTVPAREIVELCHCATVLHRVLAETRPRAAAKAAA